MKSILVSGSSGLIGSEVCTHFAQLGWAVHGIDNNQRASFFGPIGDTRWNQHRLETTLSNFHHHELDIRDQQSILQLLAELRPDAIVHSAAQPSHDRASAIPFDDFDTNAVGTINLLEAVRRSCKESPFVYLSTNKVYGDRQNEIFLEEQERRWEYAGSAYSNGIPETFGVDQTTHSIFGASKTAADILIQEYGRYFNMPTCCLRGGCLTSLNHSGVELYGLLSYLVKSNIEEREYTIFGHKGKQVRDNIHALDVAKFIECFVNAPRVAEIYDIGSGKQNSCLILEAFKLVENLTGRKMRFGYTSENRVGDHICYYSDLRKMRFHYPKWNISISLNSIFEEIVLAWEKRLRTKVLVA
ncbi:MAG: NAD-dependent epimerase/dehydratase family protein [Cyanobacteria bacterium P01_D01_bin.105]